ncbi:type II toxin-antitoxin system HicB family antitoxin, partial [Akkermansia sp.]|uniref:type II toxin-antitoxin system HicB family antitoxin n=1 Tax=Akkermansia sp. TaxID=1872421 RepID=UPI0031B811F9|nr:type II toxin-antitoxin system HicB family antitoxin [Akkermansia sp.]
MTPHYTINIEWSDEDASFIATVPQLPGCMADGPPEEAALAEAKRAIQDWLE